MEKNRPYTKIDDAIQAKQPFKILIPITKLFQKKGKKQEKEESIKDPLWERWRFKS